MEKNDKNKTATYGNSENQKTSLYNRDQDETVAYSNLKSKEFKTKKHRLSVGDKVTLKGREFSISGIISEGTGEATIYKIEDSTKNTFALKLYIEFINHIEEPNYDTLCRIKDITDPDILKLHDFGVGVDKYIGKHCFEISDFAEGGDLVSVDSFKEKYKADFIEKHVVREIFLGIKKLHENKIYHCDLKPQNVFYLDKDQTDIIIGDYGSAKAYDLETEKELRRSSTIKGTDAYLPPEQARGIISEKNDYYSFGIILLHLLYSEQLTNGNNIKQIDKRKFEKIVERQYNFKSIVDFNTDYQRLNTLIEGLTLINHYNRFGKAEVEKWLNGEDVEVKHNNTEISSVQPVKLGYATIRNEKDFINILETKETWWEDIFEDVDTYFALKAWLGSYHDIASRKLFDEMIHFYKPMGKEYVKEAAIRYFQPEMDIQIDMSLFNFFTTENIKEEVEKYITKLDDIWKITSFEKMRFYLFQLEFSLKQVGFVTGDGNLAIFNSLIEKISSAFGMVPEDFASRKTQIQDKFSAKNKKESYIQLLKLFYTFNKERTYKDTENRKFDDIYEIALSYATDETLFHDNFCNVELTVYLINKQLNHIQLKDYSEFLFEVFHDHIKSNINVGSINFSEKKAIVHYNFNKSLTEFLSSKGINKKIIFKGDDKTIELQTPLIPSGKNLYRNFISEICKNHSVSERSFEKNSLEETKTSISKFTKSYKRNQSNKATIFSTGLIVYSLPAIASMIGIVVLLFMPNALKYLGLAGSDWALPGLIGLIYLTICVLLIPSIIFYFHDSAEDLHEDFEYGMFLEPHKLVGGIIIYSILSFIGLIIIYVILMIVIGIGSIFSDYKTDPTVEIIFNFLTKLSAFIVLVGAFRPLIKFYERTKNESEFVKHYIRKKVITFFTFMILCMLIAFYMSDTNMLVNNTKNMERPSLELQKQIKDSYIVTTEVANIRSGPSTDTPVIGQLMKNDEVEFIFQYNMGWTLIKYKDQEAYIYSSLIKKKQ